MYVCMYVFLCSCVRMFRVALGAHLPYQSRHVSTLTFFFVSGTLSVSRQTAWQRKPLPAPRETRHTLSAGTPPCPLVPRRVGPELLLSPRCGSKTRKKTRLSNRGKRGWCEVLASSNRISPPVTGCSCTNCRNLQVKFPL